MPENNNPNSENQPIEPSLSPQTKSRKKTLTIIGLIAIIATASIIGATLILTDGLTTKAETLTLNLNYNAGEKMDYSMKMTASLFGETTTETATYTEEILSVQGDIITKRITTETSAPSYIPSSYTVKMDKTGKIIDLGSLPSEVQEMYSSYAAIPGFGTYFSLPEVKVGDTWSLPLNMEYNVIALQGTISYRVIDVKSISVPAGTYETIGIDINSDNIQLEIAGLTENLDMTVNFNGHMDLEKGTCRLLQLDLNSLTSVTFLDETQSSDTNIQMQLTKHTR